MRVQYIMAPEIRALGLRACVVAEITGFAIADAHPELDALKAAAADRVAAMSEDAIGTNAVLGGYRDLVRGIGRSPKKFPPAAENLLRGIQRTHKVPTINTAVDAYNLVVAKRFLALGVHDLDKIGTTVTFRLSPGDEPFIAVGSRDVKRTQAGDFVYADEQRVLAWLDSRDSDEVKISLATTSLAIVIQGTPQTAREYTRAAAEEAAGLITRFCGGSVEIADID